jgi:multiple sugar transport system permease protein
MRHGGPQLAPVAVSSREGLRPRAEQATSTSRRRRRGRPGSSGLAPYLFLLPWLVGLVGITLGPMLASLYLSFTNYSFVGPFHWIGAANYVRMFTDDPRYLAAAGVTLHYVFISVPLQLGFALALAVLLNRGIRGLAIYRSVYYLPSLLGSSVAVAILWRQVFGGAGLVNQVLGYAGIHNAPNWIESPEHALQTLIVLNVWTFGSPMIIFLAGLRQIPADLYEAAAVDGAARTRQFWRITVPLLTPVIFFNLVLQMIHAFQAFTQAYIISGGKGGPVDSTLFYSLYLYERGFTEFNMGYASAMAWVLLLVIAGFTAMAFVTSRYWVYYGDR